jgi:hypothetical protein
MPSYMVDSMRQPFTATGIVDAVMEWEETPEGKRRPSKDKQARNEDTGVSLWQVEVLYFQTSFGRRSTVTARVQVEAEVEPNLRSLGPVAFEGLRVEVRINSAGGFVEYWSAERLLTAPKEAPKPAGERAA